MSAVNDLFLSGSDAASLGLLLCETPNASVAEYALRDIQKPIGFGTYRVTRELPASVRDELPTVEDLEEVTRKLRTDGTILRNDRKEDS